MAAIAKLVGQKGKAPGGHRSSLNAPHVDHFPHTDQPSMTSAASSFVYKSRLRTEPTAANLALWQQTFWSRLEALVDELGTVCIRTYALEKVLRVKRDLDSQESFLDEALTVSLSLGGAVRGAELNITVLCRSWTTSRAPCSGRA